MSSMLEQAVVDAKSLREAAIRNAEETLVEKYSDDIKEAVEKLLEQDEEEMLGMAPPPMGAPGPGAALGMAPAPGEGDMGALPPEVPLAATDGEDLCPCPESGEEVELDLTAIKGELVALEGGEGEMGVPLPHEELAGGMAMAEEVFTFDEQRGLLAENDSAPQARPDTKPLVEGVQQTLEEVEDNEEEFNLSEEELTDLLEKVIVDMAPVSNGWAGRPLAELEHEADKHKAVLAQEHEIDVLTQENRKLEGYILKLQESIEIFKAREHNYNEAVSSLKEKFSEMSLSNARLLYTNKVLNSASLNERQKSRVADAISNVNSAEEAKVIFEALQNAVGTSPAKRRGPKSLSEAVEKRNSSLLAGRRNKQPKSDVPDGAKSRMQRLAGIK